MMKKYLLFLFLCPLFMQAQDCPIPSATEFLHGNAIKATIRNDGYLFWNFEDDTYKASFQVPYRGNDSPSSIFSTALVMGGFVENELKIAYNRSPTSNSGFDYWAGPLNMQGETFDTLHCHQFDKVWTVNRYEIESFLQDLSDNDQIDSPIPNIMGYPAKGNPYFENIHGFALPEREQGFAPFFDVNEDGLYQPEEGDYPHPPNVHPSIIPEQITWSVFNDTRPGAFKQPLQVEVQLTTYALSCEDNPILNHTVFTNYQVLNTSNTTIDSFYVGLRTDFDLGCYTDDGLGSYPEMNTFYTYNRDAIDGQTSIFCPNNVPTYPWNVPVQTATLLNQSLDYFMYSATASQGQPPQCITDYTSLYVAYNFFSSNLVTNDPLTYGGSGCYQEEPTTFAFPNNPNDPNGWSMRTSAAEISPDFLYKGFSTTYFDSFPPQAILSLDYAWSFHQHPDSNHLQNVNLMYENIPLLQDMYDDGFTNTCQQEELCETDCVWTGDTNADGIANHQDLLPIAVALATSGSPRPAPYNWSPQSNEDWIYNFPDGNVNYKHIDANGDGLVLREDFEMTQIHYGFTRPDYVAEDVYSEGTDLFLVARNDINVDSIAQFNVSFDFELADIPNLYGLSFTIEYDTLYVNNCRIFGSGNWDYTKEKISEIDYVQSETNGIDILTSDDMPRLLVYFYSSFNEPLPSATTHLRFKNIKANDRMGNPIELGAQDLALTLVDVPVTVEETSSSTFKVYPNPVLNKLYIELPQNVDKLEVIHIKMWNTVGQLVFSQKNSAGETEIDVDFLVAGIYFLTVEQGDFIRTRKFVKD